MATANCLKSAGRQLVHDPILNSGYFIGICFNEYVIIYVLSIRVLSRQWIYGITLFLAARRKTANLS